jgi:hypothetical protein
MNNIINDYNTTNNNNNNNNNNNINNNNDNNYNYNNNNKNNSRYEHPPPTVPVPKRATPSSIKAMSFIVMEDRMRKGLYTPCTRWAGGPALLTDVSFTELYEFNCCFDLKILLNQAICVLLSR